MQKDSAYFFLSSLGYPQTNLFLKGQSTWKEPKCLKGEYLCHYNKYCIQIQMVCDGISHCYQGDDEYDCGKCRINFNL